MILRGADAGRLSVGSVGGSKTRPQRVSKAFFGGGKKRGHYPAGLVPGENGLETR